MGECSLNIIPEEGGGKGERLKETFNTVNATALDEGAAVTVNDRNTNNREMAMVRRGPG